MTFEVNELKVNGVKVPAVVLLVGSIGKWKEEFRDNLAIPISISFAEGSDVFLSFDKNYLKSILGREEEIKILSSSEDVKEVINSALQKNLNFSPSGALLDREIGRAAILAAIHSGTLGRVIGAKLSALRMKIGQSGITNPPQIQIIGRPGGTGSGARGILERYVQRFECKGVVTIMTKFRRHLALQSLDDGKSEEILENYKKDVSEVFSLLNDPNLQTYVLLNPEDEEDCVKKLLWTSRLSQILFNLPGIENVLRDKRVFLVEIYHYYIDPSKAEDHLMSSWFKKKLSEWLTGTDSNLIESKILNLNGKKTEFIQSFSTEAINNIINIDEIKEKILRQEIETIDSVLQEIDRKIDESVEKIKNSGNELLNYFKEQIADLVAKGALDTAEKITENFQTFKFEIKENLEQIDFAKEKEKIIETFNKISRAKIKLGFGKKVENLVDNVRSYAIKRLAQGKRAALESVEGDLRENAEKLNYKIKKLKEKINDEINKKDHLKHPLVLVDSKALEEVKKMAPGSIEVGKDLELIEVGEDQLFESIKKRYFEQVTSAAKEHLKKIFFIKGNIRPKHSGENLKVVFAPPYVRVEDFDYVVRSEANEVVVFIIYPFSTSDLEYCKQILLEVK